MSKKLKVSQDKIEATIKIYEDGKMTAPEACKALGVSTATFYNYRNRILGKKKAPREVVTQVNSFAGFNHEPAPGDQTILRLREENTRLRAALSVIMIEQIATGVVRIDSRADQ